LRYVQLVPWIERGVAVVVGVMGPLQLKDVAAFHRGPTLGVPERAKPGNTPNGMTKKMERKAKSARTTMMITMATLLPLFETVMGTS